MPRTSRGVSTRDRPGSMSPSKLSSRPMHSMPLLVANLTTARMTALSPGASPPPVRMPMRLMAVTGFDYSKCPERHVARLETRVLHSLFAGALARAYTRVGG